MLFYRDGRQGVSPFTATNPFSLLRMCAFLLKRFFFWKQSREKNGENGQVQIPAAWFFLEGFTEKLSRTLDNLYTL